MNRAKTSPAANLDTGLIIRLILCVALLAGAGVGFVGIKIRQHAMGEMTRTIEGEIRELRAFNQVLRSDISTLTSHKSLTAALAEGRIALVPISDQFVARLTPPTMGGVELPLGTAAAGQGDLRP